MKNAKAFFCAWPKQKNVMRERWEAELKELGAEPPVYDDTLARRLNRWWNRMAGSEIAIRRMEATEEKQEAEFHDQAERAFAGEQEVQEFLRKSALEEKAHARALSAMAPPVSPRRRWTKFSSVNAGTDAAVAGWRMQFTARTRAWRGVWNCFRRRRRHK